MIAQDFLPRLVYQTAVKPTEAEPHDADRGGLPCNLKAFVQQRLDDESSNIYAETLEMMERYLLTEILRLAEGNQSEASRILGITRGSLRHKIRSLGISIENRVDAGD